MTSAQFTFISSLWHLAIQILVERDEFYDVGQLLAPDELTALEQLTQKSLNQLVSHYADIRTALATGS